MVKKQRSLSLFCINDHQDLLIEILTRLDDRTLAVASTVCRLWCELTRQDSFWEALCFRHVSPPRVRPVVAAMGGFRRLYRVCVGPALARLDRVDSVWTREELETQLHRLSLSLFSVYYYERLGARREDGAAASLMFLGEPVNVK
ncbi:hypothetical protein Syun_026797 [Stephania yunnanensis]|uniref:F-box domain-containing protein n=1 Tax=Stephania yunnanensis TaxID=152371 RepID=A0AAP0EEH0_9MAGN